MDLDKVSYYLSYTDSVPIINIPSGIVHLICGIRDLIFGAQPQELDGGCTNLTDRKLDDWSHLTKAIAILSIIGNLFILIKLFTCTMELRAAAEALKKDNMGRDSEEIGSQLDQISPNLLNNKWWLETAFRNGIYESNLFERMDPTLKSDREWILDLLNKEIFPLENFADLPQEIRNDRAVAIAAFENADGNNALLSASELIVRHITDRSLLECHDGLCRGAVRLGVIPFNELHETRKCMYEFGIEAVKFDHTQWATLPAEMQKNRELLTALKGWFNLGLSQDEDCVAGAWVRKIIDDRGLMKNFEEYFSPSDKIESPA